MQGNSAATLADYLRGIRPGEDIVIEYTPYEPAHLLLHRLLECLEEIGQPFVIVDELDHLHIFRTHLKLSGLSTALIDSARVIKMGGALSTGRVVGRIDLSKELPIRKKTYEEVVKRMGDRYTIRIVLGFDKVLAMNENSPKELERLFRYMIRPHMGDESRSTLYFINTSLLSTRTLMELREHASRILQFELREKRMILKVVKSIDFSEYGMELDIAG